MERIRQMDSEGLPVHEIVSKMNVRLATVSAVLGQSPLFPSVLKELESPFRTGSREERDERIRRMDAEGLSQRAIADAVGLSRSSIGRILREGRDANRSRKDTK